MTSAKTNIASNPSDAKAKDVDPALLNTWLHEGGTLLIDVREDFEHAEERIPGAVLHALSKFDPARVRELAGEQRVVFQCRSGKRSRDASERYAAAGGSAFSLAGGIEAWKAAGLETRRSEGAPPMPIMRQVQIVAGSIVLLGIALGTMVSPWFLILSAFVGAGLTFAGLSGWCGMALLLGRMPWNRVRTGAPSAP